MSQRGNSEIHERIADYEEPQHRADEEGGAPAEVRRQNCGVEWHDEAAGAEGRPNPKAAVDDEMGPAAISRRHELLNG